MPGGRPKLPPKTVQLIDFELMPPVKGYVRNKVREALKAHGIVPVHEGASVGITWVERDTKHTHAQISAGVMAMFEALDEAGIVDMHASRLDAHQRLKSTNPHIELVITGRPKEGVGAFGAKTLTPEELEVDVPFGYASISGKRPKRCKPKKKACI